MSYQTGCMSLNRQVMLVGCLSKSRILHPEIYREFKTDNCVVQWSAHKFPLITKDQSHEQTNKILQANGGISYLYDNPDARALHMLSAPHSVHVVKEFEDLLTSPIQSTAHHEEAQPFQIRFLRDVKALSAVLREQGKPFEMLWNLRCVSLSSSAMYLAK